MNDRDSTFYAGAIAAGAFVGAAIWAGLTFGVSSEAETAAAQTPQCWPVVEIPDDTGPIRGCMEHVSDDGRLILLRTCEGYVLMVPSTLKGIVARLDCNDKPQWQGPNK